MKKIVFILSILVLFASCDLFTGPSGDNTHPEIVISNNKEITMVGDTVYFYEEEADSLGKTTAFAPIPMPRKKKDIGYDVVLAARIPSVMVDGFKVQANDIVIKGNKAFIAYNFAGEPFRGAIQVVDIKHKGKPEIEEEILLPSMDVNALYIDGDYLIFGGAADPDIWGEKSFIGKIKIRDIKPNKIAESITSLPSHAVTGITKSGREYHVTVGAADGQLIKMDKDFKIQDSIDLDDGRDVAEYDRGVIVITGTTDSDASSGKVNIISRDYNSIDEIPVGDFGSDYHKSTIEVYDNDVALLALSEAGMKVLSLEGSQEFIFEAPNPKITSTGLSYTNSVSADGDLIFTANGEYGFRVFSVCNNDFEETVLAGYYPYEDLVADQQNYSANHVEYKSHYLFVACGVGGVQVFYLNDKDDDDWWW